MGSNKSDWQDQIVNLRDAGSSELLEILGAYALSQTPKELRDTFASDIRIDVERLQGAGRHFAQSLAPILHDAICGHDGVGENLDQLSVEELLLVLLPALGLAPHGLVPTAFVALSYLIVRSGVRRYCLGVVEF